MKRSIIILALLFGIGIVNNSAQEALKSAEEEYYDFLALQGLTERPYLNYRTLSDSVWKIEEGASHPWENQNLGLKRNLTDKIFLKIYGPELFNSVNTSAPYGQNDGALWQGRGYNASLTGGARLEGYGVELTLKPQLSFSQNAAFDIMKPEKSGPDFAGKGDTYGYFWGSVDAPQRFGNAPFFTWDWGDSEVRYTWKTLTVGFGTQAIWLGPAYLNSILHSNNAPTYPKFDIGLRKQRVVIPWLNWYIGEIEARLWVGYLSESDYFDNDDSNDHTMINGLSFAYAPSFLPGLTLSANRVCLVPWSWENLKYIFPNDANTIEDQKASFGFSYRLPSVGFELFGEFGVDDYTHGRVLGFLRNPFWTLAYTAGIKKAININPEKNIYGEFIFEIDWLERLQGTRNAVAEGYAFYWHHLITHGYTNRGQILGNGSTPAGNAQYLSFILYYPKGSSQIILSRNNPDNNYLFKPANNKGHNNYWGNFLIGGNTTYHLTPFLTLSGGIVYDLIINPHYVRVDEIIDPVTGNHSGGDNTFEHNLSFNFSVKFKL